MKISRTVKLKLLKAADPFVHNYMPRGLIFFIDFLIVLFSAKLTFLLVTSIERKPIDYLSFPNSLWAVVGIQVAFILLFKSYAGLVRYSSLRDAIKQFQVVGLTVVSILIINQLLLATKGFKLIINGGALIYGVISFSLLFFFRIVVKGIYGLIHNSSINTHALILGVTPHDIDMASGLIAQSSNKYKISGFINIHKDMSRNKIFGLPIFTISDLQKQRKLAGVVIIREDKLKELRQTKPEIFAELLDLKLKILKLPNLQNLPNGSGGIEFTNLKEINIEDLLQRNPIKLDSDSLLSTYKGKTIMVTGGAGSIGSEIVRQLIHFRPKKIVLVDQAETPLHNMCLELDKFHPELNYERIIANVRNRGRVHQIFAEFNPEVVFHAAAYKHVPMMEANAIEAISTNFQGTRNMTELAIEYGVERFVFVSTDKAVNPTNIMGATKRSAELYIQYLVHQKATKTNFITTRFGNVLGSNGSVVPYFKKLIAAGGPLTVTHPEITRYFMTIDEACQLVLQAGSMGKGGEIFVFDMGSPVKIVDLAKQMIRLSGLTPDVDIEIQFIGLRPGEKLYEELLADRENTSETRHEKIMIGNATSPFTDEELLSLSEKLSEAIGKYQHREALNLLKTMVPEYHCETEREL